MMNKVVYIINIDTGLRACNFPL